MAQISGLHPASNRVEHNTSKLAGLVVASTIAPPPSTSCEPSPEAKSSATAIAVKPSSMTITPTAAEQIEQSVQHLYHLGPRPVFETLCAVHGGADVIETLQAYQRLDAGVVAYLGADRLPRRRQRKWCRYEN